MQNQSQVANLIRKQRSGRTDSATHYICKAHRARLVFPRLDENAQAEKAA